MGSVQFQVAPCSSLHFSIIIGSFRCSRCSLQGFYSVAPVPSEAVPFVYLASVCRSLQCLISALKQVGGGGLLFRFASSVALRGGRGAAFPVYAAQAPGCSIWSMPCAARGSSPRVFHKSADSAAPAFCAFPAGAAQAARSLTGALSQVRQAFSPPQPQPQFLPAPIGCVRFEFSRDPPGGCRPSRISGSLWLETGGLFAVW